MADVIIESSNKFRSFFLNSFETIKINKEAETNSIISLIPNKESRGFKKKISCIDMVGKGLFNKKETTAITKKTKINKKIDLCSISMFFPNNLFRVQEKEIAEIKARTYGKLNPLSKNKIINAKTGIKKTINLILIIEIIKVKKMIKNQTLRKVYLKNSSKNIPKNKVKINKGILIAN